MECKQSALKRLGEGESRILWPSWNPKMKVFMPQALECKMGALVNTKPLRCQVCEVVSHGLLPRYYPSSKPTNASESELEASGFLDKGACGEVHEVKKLDTVSVQSSTPEADHEGGVRNLEVFNWL